MRFSAAVLALSSLLAISFTTAARARVAQDTTKTTWDGVFSADQAKRGEDQYGKSCVSCHGPDLAGLDTAPSLTGPEFNAGWADLTLDDLFERIRTTMPADGPGSLTRDQYVDVLSFLLSKDGFPAGSADLPAENATLKTIKFVVKKP
ncbi:MAG TPA: c-type cytochrome [Vicinamibacterales bacterium]|jgi:mono/diheme cytochrome c family protein